MPPGWKKSWSVGNFWSVSIWVSAGMLCVDDSRRFFAVQWRMRATIKETEV